MVRKAASEELAQLAAIESEEAQRQKAKAEELLKIALHESEQALSDKAKAEEQARLATAEREYTRQKQQDLYETIEDEIERETRKLKEENETLQAENQRLQQERYRLFTKAESMMPTEALKHGQNAIYFEMTENDFYPSERKDLILEIIKRSSASVHPGSRSAHVLQDLLKRNQSSGRRESLKREIDNLFKGYRKVESPLRSELQHLGFEFISDNHHHKIRFCDDPRYTVSFAKTPSDWRAGKNIADDICHRIL
ncbi:MAG: hypothetical protein HC919_04165 [Oscillatoriales cyanobacterium SM2_2_1]|nr:hypothetical protein [Oscillatoriales cyanobacterium SM2_2_1]